MMRVEAAPSPGSDLIPEIAFCLYQLLFCAVTVQIVTLLTGDQEFDSAKTLSAFGLGLTLFAATLVLNIVAQRIVKAYREQYD